MHLQRWLTAIVALPLLLLILLKGGPWLFLLLAALVCSVGLWELGALLLPASGRMLRLETVALGFLLLAGFALAPGRAMAAAPLLPLMFLAGCLFLLLAGHLITYGRSPAALAEMGATALALLYLPFLLGHLVWLRLLPQGEWWLLWLLLVIFAGDTGAFYTGRTLGKHKFAPKVSPGKTWEGTLGGLLASLAAGLVLGGRFLPQVAWGQLLILSLILGVVGVLGDLFESMLKRLAQVKDASGLLPGHGGILDRLDSLVFAGPVVLYFRLLFYP
ncbi:MAG: phosphatidate cytidylyltransferase [Desulfobaccales bacterium]